MLDGKKILKTRQKPATDVLIGVVRIDIVSFLWKLHIYQITHYLESQDNIFWLWKSKQMESVYNTQAACTKTNWVVNN